MVFSWNPEVQVVSADWLIADIGYWWVGFSLIGPHLMCRHFPSHVCCHVTNNKNISGLESTLNPVEEVLRTHMCSSTVSIPLHGTMLDVVLAIIPLVACLDVCPIHTTTDYVHGLIIALPTHFLCLLLSGH